MPLPAPKRAKVTQHPGSTEEEISQEPAWSRGHQHRIGYRNRQNRYAGLTHDGDYDNEDEEEQKFVEQAMKKYRELKEHTQKGELVNFQDVMKAQTDFHEHRPDAYPPGWRFVVRAREDWIRNEQDWPANIKKREKEEEEKKKKDEGERKKEGQEEKETEDGNHDDEHDWRREGGHENEKHHGAYGKGSNDENKQQENANGNENGQGTGQKSGQENGPGQNGDSSKPKSKSDYQKLREKYSPEEIVLLRHLQHEAEYIRGLQNNDGKQDSPLKTNAQDREIEIDAVDAMTPDNWIPRSGNLIRRTGQHPMNGEPRLKNLFDAGLITPNELHYVRNHGSVPRLYWDTHKLDVCDGALNLSMDDVRSKFTAINIPIALACDGNRRGELNKLKKSKGFDWGSGAVSCAYWKGAMLHEILSAAGVEREDWNAGRKYVNFEGADEPSEGKYATSIPLDYALDPGNDVILAYEMNNVPLPADHGYPLRLMIPGYVGGRSIKWLARIWISDHENDSYYHIWDNRVLPSFISEKDGEFARAMFNHPSTACMEQNLNSVIARPAQGEKLDIVEVLKKDTYRIEGYAYDGGGHEVQKVELSLDYGKTWLYCIRKFPDRPIRNGSKFWTWLHWHIDVDAVHFVRAESITVRCFNVFKNTQPEKPVWNTMGMMNNGYYIVKPSTDKEGKLVFRHPVDQEGDEGWMESSTENKLAAAKQDSGVPDRQFTRQEIEKHNTKDDCWLVINNNVYDVTSVLSWHPGGSATLLANAGKLSLEVTSSFQSIHDEYAHKKLNECVLGKVTEKAAKYMQEQAKAEAEEAAKSDGESKSLLQSKKWVPVTLKERKKLSEDTFAYTFAYDTNNGKGKLGLGTCQHIQFGIHMEDKMLIRSYTPTRPIMSKDDDGTFELTVKTYYPDENQPGGAFSNFLYTMPIGEKVEVNGPTGEIEYYGDGKFEIEGQEKVYKKISLVLGGSGLTPGYSLLQAIIEKGDKVEVRVIDANKSEDDILLHDDLNRIERESEGRIKIAHVLSHPKDEESWQGLKGHVNADIIKDKLFSPGDDSVVFLCGPPGMIQKAALPALKDWGYKDDENMFGF